MYVTNIHMQQKSSFLQLSKLVLNTVLYIKLL